MLVSRHGSASAHRCDARNSAGNALTALGIVRDEQGPLAGEVVELEALTDEQFPPETRQIKAQRRQEPDRRQGPSTFIAKLLLPTGPVLYQAFRDGHSSGSLAGSRATGLAPSRSRSSILFAAAVTRCGSALCWDDVLSRGCGQHGRAAFAAKVVDQKSGRCRGGSNHPTTRWT